VDDAWQNLGEKFAGRTASTDHLCGDVFALGSLDETEFVERDSLFLGKTDRRPCRRADIVVGDGLGRAGNFAFDVGLFGDDASGYGSQAARSAEGLKRDTLDEVFRGKVLVEDGFQFADRARKHASRNFFGANFE